jgi:hypothetical protein
VFNSNLPESELVKVILQPLLEDFQHWFGRARLLLEAEEVSFLETEKQADLLARVQQAQQEVSTTQMLIQATEGQVGVEPEVLMPWHHLVTECWQVAIRFRLEQSAP